MRYYHALCSDCPECGKENVAFLAHSHQKRIDLPTKHMTCDYCFHEYHTSIQELALRPTTQDEIDELGGEHVFAWI